ncbi:MAG: C39 family peptidase [Thermodesulfobacteriota bacterium]
MCRSRTFLIAAIFAAALSGCAAVRAGFVVEDLTSHPEAGGYIKGVPVVEQATRTCGPAALASVIGYYAYIRQGEPMDPGLPGEVARAVYKDKLRGTLAMDMLLYAKERGFAAEHYGGGFDDLKRKVSAGAPLILFLDLGLGRLRAGHFVVAVGYDDRLGAVVVHRGGPTEEAMTYDALERRWSRTGYSTLLIVPGDGQPPPQVPPS